MDQHASLAPAELEAGLEAVVAFTECCRFVTNDELRGPAARLAADAETLFQAASAVLDQRRRHAARRAG
jgi:hypothetical protein